MTREEYKKLSKNEKKILNDSLNAVSKFMTKPSDNSNDYKKELKENITDFTCSRDNKEKVEKALENHSSAVGVCKPLAKRNIIHRIFRIYTSKTKFKSKIAINDALSNSYKSNLMVSIHEVNHADTNMYNEVIEGGYYSGLMKKYRKNINTFYRYGEGLNECINELYTQIQFFDAYPQFYMNINSIDELIYGTKLPTFAKNITPNGELYRRLTIIAKLLIITCDNDLSVPYESLMNDNKRFIDKTVKLGDDNYYLKNDLMYAGKSHAKYFEKKFDEIYGEEGAFENLLKYFDYLLEEGRNKKPFNKEVIGDIIRLIDHYKNKKFDLLHKAGLWTITKKADSNAKYEHYRNFLIKYYNLQPAVITDIPNFNSRTLIYKVEKTGND